MQNRKWEIDKLLEIRYQVRQKSPLIHCITNPISIHDCANAVLAVGARPIMAEHPGEVCEITDTAKALAVNLGNITNVRMESMLLAGRCARKKDIPVVIDLVGVGCSSLRLAYGRRFLEECSPWVIKGNLSELKALAGVENHADGIDVGEKDRITKDSVFYSEELLKDLSRKYKAVVMATGEIDLVTDGQDFYTIENGCKMLAKVTGTGCMLNVLTAAFLSEKQSVESSLLALLLMGVSGELANQTQGPATFQIQLMDLLYGITDMELRQKCRIQKR